jgi:hypothetical protein
MIEATRESDVVLAAASEVRARVADALKGKIERDLLTARPPALEFSKFEHVKNPAEEPLLPLRDEALALSLWGSDEDERVRAFAARLASLKA